MANPVWVLSVDLQTKTATFQTGMAEAARSARSAFKDIGDSAKEGGRNVESSMLSGRLALHSFTNTLTGNVENAIVDVVDELQRFSFAAKAIPFLAVAGGVGLLVTGAIELVSKYKEWREEARKLADEQTKFGTAVQESLNGLDDKLLQAEKRTDELRNDHLGALRKELELIDHAKLTDLIQEFDVIAKAADAAFASLTSHWYNLNIGSAGAKHALDEFKVQYDSLLARGKDKDASDLLAGTLKSAQTILDLQNQAAGAHGKMGASDRASGGAAAASYYGAIDALKKSGVGYSEKEVQAQQELVNALNAQVSAQQKLEILRRTEADNAKRETGNQAAGLHASAASAAIASQTRISEMSIAADRAAAASRLEISRSSIADRLANDIEFAGRERDVQTAANQEQIATLNKTSNDYANQKRALEEKTLEIAAEYSTKVAELTAKAATDSAKQELANLEQSERDKIAATQEGSNERLAAIAEAIQRAQLLHLQDTDYYRQLQTQQVQAARKTREEQAKLAADAAGEEANHGQRMKELVLAAEVERQNVVNSTRRVSDQQLADQAVEAENKQFAIKQEALQKEAAALNTSANDYQNKLKAIQNKELELVQQHENQITAIKDKALAQQTQRQQTALFAMENGFAQSGLRVLLGQQSVASMLGSISQQIASNTISAALAEKNGLESTKLDQAKAAARSMYLAGTKFPWPTNIVMAPTLGALGFAAMMAFENGGIVPGVGRGDVVPAMLTPGEGVVPKGVMDGLSNIARSGGLGAGATHYHSHINPTYNVQALDSKGVEKVFKRNTAALQKVANAQMRRMNK